jgi:hypothetical protein
MLSFCHIKRLLTSKSAPAICCLLCLSASITLMTHCTQNCRLRLVCLYLQMSTIVYQECFSVNQQKLGNCKKKKSKATELILNNQTSFSSSVHFIYLKKKKSILLSYSNTCYRVIGCILYVCGNGFGILSLIKALLLYVNKGFFFVRVWLAVMCLSACPCLTWSSDVQGKRGVV